MKITGIIGIMKDKEISYKDYQIFLFKALFWVGTAWIGFVFALGGFFYGPLVWILVLIFGFSLFYYLKYERKISMMPSREMIIVSAVSLAIVILFSCFSTPSVFSGRDQGSISEAAIRLAQNHTFEFSTQASNEFFKIYGPGKALHFPGFYYTNQGNLVTQFPLVYIVWLALFYSIFGIAGFLVANALLLFIFFISFYLLVRLFLDIKYAATTFLFAATSFLFMWFSKFTLSENMALPLLWLSILSLMLFLRNPRKLSYYVFLASIMLLFFTRIEGIAFLAISIIIISLSKNAQKFVKENAISRFFGPVIFFVAIFAANTFRDINFYREIAKALLSPFMPFKAQYLNAVQTSVHSSFYLEKLFSLYGLAGFFMVGAIGICFYAWRKEIYKLIPFFIILPTFIYFFDSHITPDHPWMLRRFMFSLLPVGIFYTGLFLGQKLENKPRRKKEKGTSIFSGILAVMLIVSNLPAFINFLTFSENKNLLSQAKSATDNFSSQNLILVDREATGDGWNMISGPLGSLYGKNAAYFFNTNDLARLDLEKFHNVYLIAPDKQESYYLNSTIGNKLEEKAVYNFTFPKLNIKNNDAIEFPEKVDFAISGKIFKVAK